MRPPTKLVRIRFTHDDRAGLKALAANLGTTTASIIRAFVRLGLGQAKGAAIGELKILVRADVVRRGRELGKPQRKAREKGSVAA